MCPLFIFSADPASAWSAFSFVAVAGFQVRTGARDPVSAARRAPHHEWVKADFFHLTCASDWSVLLSGVDAVVNCVGVLQDGGRDSNRIAHVDGPRALITACEAMGLSRLIHVSAVGADQGVDTLYAASKAEAEAMVSASNLDWVILRPSLVVDRAAFGGTGLIRALSVMPPLYFKLFRTWFMLGWPAFAGVIGIYWLMVVKPSF